MDSYAMLMKFATEFANATEINWDIFTNQTTTYLNTWTLRHTFVCALIITLATIGLAGNLLSCIVIRLYLLRLSGTYVLFLFLCIADSLVVIVLTIEALFNSLAGSSYELTFLQCKCFRFFWYFSLQLSAWLIVTLAVERYITLRMCHVIRDRVKVLRRAWITGAAIVVFVALLNLHFFFTTGVIRLETGRRFTCGYITQDPTKTMRIVNSIQVVFGWILPYVITLIFNIRLICHTWQSSRPSHIRTTSTLLVVTFAFIFLTLPYSIYVILVLTPFWGHQPTDSLLSINQINAMNITDDVVRYLLFLNNSLAFVFYLTGRQFRRAIRHLIYGTNRGHRSSVTRSSLSLSTKEGIQNPSSIAGGCTTEKSSPLKASFLGDCQVSRLCS